MMEVSLHVLLWNGERDLPDLVRSLRALSYPNLHIRMIDNGSIDGSRAYIQEHAPEWLVGCNTKNIGFAAGHNQLISLALHRWEGEDLSQKVVVVTNQDMILDAECISKMVEAFERENSCGAVQPKVLRAIRPATEHDERMLSDVIDTAGLVMNSWWRMEDRGAGVRDEGQFDERQDIVGPGGAFAAYRASALVGTVENGQYFDEDFFSYREDCDLALRLVRRGYVTVFAPQAKAWHYRGMFGVEKRNLLQRLRDRRQQQSFRNAWSMRNQLFFLVKHIPLQAWKSFPVILFQEGGRVCYALIFEPDTRKLLIRALLTFQKMRKKRKEIFKNTRISSNELCAYAKR